MERSQARTFAVVVSGGLTLALAFCALGSLLYLVVARGWTDSSPFSSYSDLLDLALTFSGPCAFPSWAAFVHVSLVEPRVLRRPLGRGAIHGLACVVVPCLLMPLVVRGAPGVILILGLLATSAVVGTLIALACARLARRVGLADGPARGRGRLPTRR